MKLIRYGLLSLAVFLVGARPATASPIIGAASATTNMGEVFALANAINQVGLSPGYASGVTDFDTYVAGAIHTSAPGTDWVSASNPANGEVTFDLGSLMTIDQIAVWNFADNNPLFSVTQLTVLASVDAAFSSPTNLGTFSLSVPPLATTLAQLLNIGVTNAQFIRFQNFVSNGNGVGGLALGEVAFRSAVPEPASMLLMGSGLLIGARKLRRRKS